MAYVKQEWKDEVLNGPEQYNITAPGTNINGAEITLSTPIIQAGTQVTAERMNKIEQGIFDAHEIETAGIWTPVYKGLTTAGSYTYSAQSGTYYKIKNLVLITFDLTIAATVTAGTGFMGVTGLPVTIAPKRRGISSINVTQKTFLNITNLDFPNGVFIFMKYNVSGSSVSLGYAYEFTPEIGSRIAASAIYRL